MLEKWEVYPYHRVADQGASRRRKWVERGRRIQKRLPDSKDLIRKAAEFKAGLNIIMNAETVLIGVGAMVMARAFVLGELLPFIFAYIAGFGRQNTGRRILVGVGAVLGLFSCLSGAGLWVNLITVLVLMTVLNRARIPGGHQWWGIPVLTTALLFLVKTLLVIKTGFSLYAEMVIVFEALISGVLTFIAMVGEEVIEERKHLVHFTFEDKAAFMVLGIGLVLGLNEVNVWGLSIGGILCRVGILLTAFLWGSGAGTMVGVMSGIIPSLASRVFAQSMGMYSVSGLLAGLFRSFGQLGSIIGFMLGNLAFSIFITDSTSALMGIWETGIASVIFYLLPASWKDQMAIQTIGPINMPESRSMQIAASQLEGITRGRMEDLVHIFEEMSVTLQQSKSPASEPSSYLGYLYEQISSGVCGDCPRYPRCWDREAYQTSRELLDVFALAETTGEVKESEISEAFKARCFKTSEVAAETSRLFETLRINEYWAQRFYQSRQLVSMQLKGVSQVIKNLLEEMGARAILNADVRKAVIDEMNRRGITVRDVSAMEQGDRQLLLSLSTDSCPDGNYCETCIAPAISGILGEKLKVTGKKCPRSPQGACSILLSRGFVFRVLSGAAQVGKEAVCGDSFTIATLNQGKQLIALSDGMGVGEKAWEESQAAVRLLENLLGSGFNQETTLKTINSLLLLRSTAESFATLDMAMIDLYSGEVDFIKIGSAPSYIKQGKKVTTIVSSSPPIGILEDIDLISDHRQLKNGDILVLVTDGLVENPRKGLNEGWIPRFLGALNESDPQRIAEDLLHKALQLCRNQPLDDMTVICALIDFEPDP